MVNLSSPRHSYIHKPGPITYSLGGSLLVSIGGSFLASPEDVALAIAHGIACPPLAPAAVARRVLYVDSEAPLARARDDLKRMCSHREATINDNLLLMIDAYIDDEPLNLSRSKHFDYLVRTAKQQRIDLLIVDTAASAFELLDENNNAEVTRRVMNPMRRLAREANCAVLFSHHAGKGSEQTSETAAYRGRGASAWGALSRSVFTLERDAARGADYVKLTCVKSKCETFESVLLRLNRETRWFEACDEKPAAAWATLSAADVAEFIATRGRASTSEITKHFASRASERTIKARIKDAEQLQLIAKNDQRRIWKVVNDEGLV